MLISAIVCTYNRAESLRQTLAALQRQRLDAGVQAEILVVDNASTDATADVVAQACHQARWPIHYLHEPRQGKTHACNLAITSSRGELLAFTDDDVTPEPTWLQALHEAAVRYQADCVGGKVLPRWAHQPPAWFFDEQVGWKAFGMLALLDRGDDVIVSDAPETDFLYGANIAYRKTLFDEVGSFRTDLGPRGAALLRGDDSELMERIRQAGKRAVYTPRAVVHHAVEPERMTLSYLRRWRFGWGRSLVRMGGGAGVPRWLIRECAGHGMSAVGAYLTGARMRGIRAESSFWLQLGQIVEGAQARSRSA